ncbi:alcohol dehydrogenase [Coniophora puteana RWD-64-598 SS2]|uniref:Alcohol dehydrogenase n=1 Tax=Coniophora puteana (strain RWD-64-598) TaxID=741705 RepID=A0A5M3MQ61_CONPW|nr:alcohol dehydrogenase [Coniophora puteana RWD-64-598 SS2]EIW81322.1 alcohol dehydrogenase [Coniophora puteana RWD-64-598 SS2]
MAPVTNGRVIFKEVPKGYPEAGKTMVYEEQTIDPETIALKPGEWLVKVLVLSVDPYMRGRMREPSKKSYNDPYTIGEPIENYGVGLVLRSENPKFKAGDYCQGVMDYAHYAICHKTDKFYVIENKPENLPWTTYVGAAGMPGETAYYAWKEYAFAKKGEVAFVSSGAGAVGSLVIQLAKRDGLKVIASAGTEDKVQYMKKIGADVVFNYKTTDTKEVLEKEGPIDVYWDNVGGETLEAAIGTANQHARFIECGMISGYNGQFYPVKNLMMIIQKELRINGFIVNSLRDKYVAEFQAAMPKLLASGEINFREDVTRGLENGDEAVVSVQKGTNVAKAVIVVADQ